MKQSATIIVIIMSVIIITIMNICTLQTLHHATITISEKQD